eukprot:jgi/Bigna1/84311/fgenesh1_pg.129_\
MFIPPTKLSKYDGESKAQHYTAMKNDKPQSSADKCSIFNFGLPKCGGSCDDVEDPVNEYILEKAGWKKLSHFTSRYAEESIRMSALAYQKVDSEIEVACDKCRSTILGHCWSRASNEEEDGFYDLCKNCYSTVDDKSRLSFEFYYLANRSTKVKSDRRLMEMEFIHFEEAKGETLVQWTLSRKRQTLFLAFRGTSTLFDWLIDAAPGQRKMEYGVKVQAAIQNALHSGDSLDKVANLIEKNWKGVRDLVLTGHSLGGAYAVVAAAEFLASKRYRHIREYFTSSYTFGENHCNIYVNTFGAPSVIVPPGVDSKEAREEEGGEENGQKCVGEEKAVSKWWKTLNTNTHAYVHRNDPVPRNSCKTWLFEVMPLFVQTTTASVLTSVVSRIALGISVKDLVSLIQMQALRHESVFVSYQPVGTTIFLEKRSELAKNVKPAAASSVVKTPSAADNPLQTGYDEFRKSFNNGVGSASEGTLEVFLTSARAPRRSMMDDQPRNNDYKSVLNSKQVLEWYPKTLSTLIEDHSIDIYLERVYQFVEACRRRNIQYIPSLSQMSFHFNMKPQTSVMACKSDGEDENDKDNSDKENDDKKEVEEEEGGEDDDLGSSIGSIPSVDNFRRSQAPPTRLDGRKRSSEVTAGRHHPRSSTDISNLRIIYGKKCPEICLANGRVISEMYTIRSCNPKCMYFNVRLNGIVYISIMSTSWWGPLKMHRVYGDVAHYENGKRVMNIEPFQSKYPGKELKVNKGDTIVVKMQVDSSDNVHLYMKCQSIRNKLRPRSPQVSRFGKWFYAGA